MKPLAQRQVNGFALVMLWLEVAGKHSPPTTEQEGLQASVTEIRCSSVSREDETYRFPKTSPTHQDPDSNPEQRHPCSEPLDTERSPG